NLGAGLGVPSRTSAAQRSGYLGPALELGRAGGDDDLPSGTARLFRNLEVDVRATGNNWNIRLAHRQHRNRVQGLCHVLFPANSLEGSCAAGPAAMGRISRISIGGYVLWGAGADDAELASVTFARRRGLLRTCHQFIPGAYMV